MSVLNRTTGRLAKAAAVGAFGVAIALGSTACSAGKISQTTNQLPAVNGGAGTIGLAPSEMNGETISNGQISIRNAQIVYPVKNSDATFDKGGPFDVSFAIANDSPTREIKLVEIIGPQGSNVEITPPKSGDSASQTGGSTIAPNGVLIAGVPANVNTSAAQAADIERGTVTLSNAKGVRPGLNMPLVFKFEVHDLSGKRIETVQTSVETPVDAGTLPERRDAIADARAKQGEH
ncbi:copper-binding protein [Gordonia zhaorongruii]|uniref:copper-binding protein n=1 Tax=Gordonia zhaorongruii TaxID=2597659 RepID=UPI0010489975|nr:copper-binding protein [Gordonia zhaorongruii]